VHHETIAIPSAEGVEAMKAGRVDVGLAFGSMPNTCFLSMGLDVKLLPYDDAGLVSLPEDLGRVPIVIPAGTYSFLDAEIVTVAGPSPLAVRPDMPDEVVTAGLERSDLLFAVSAEARSQMRPVAVTAQRNGESFHPVALEFYRDMGWVD
jgi:TRAP-type uncharacterized transport system substrate-binding protein